MFSEVKLRTFTLKELVGRTVEIRVYRADGATVTVAVDIKSGDLFVLDEKLFIPTC